jgi:L-alanine-DL-glutamate epimerase-like enolase superfamily enzyme
MYDATHYYGRRGVVIHAMSAIDIALWDIKGKLEERPVGQLLGQPQRESLLAYGTVYPLGRTPDEARHAIDRGLALGLRAIKLVADPWWGEDPDGAATVIRAAREHVGRDIRLILDAATAWAKPQEGLWLMPLLKECGFAFIEAPLPLDNVAGHAEFQGWDIPVGSGDLGLTTHAEYIPFFEIGRIDIAQPDVTMVGGFTELRRLAALARRYGKRVVTHGYKSNITIACNLHFLSQHDEDEMLEYSTSESPLRWRLTRERFPIETDGRVAVPSAPGLGVSLDPDAVAEFRIS